MFEDQEARGPADAGFPGLSERLGLRAGEELAAALEAAADPERLARLDEATLVALVLAAQRTIEWAQRLRGAALQDLDRRRVPGGDGRFSRELREPGRRPPPPRPP